jgi:hypothetical protein
LDGNGSKHGNNNEKAKFERLHAWLGQHNPVTMDLIAPTTILQTLMAIPLVMTLIPVLVSVIQALLANPVVRAFVNTTLVALETTKGVWQPITSAAVAVIRQVYRFLVAITPTLVNATTDMIRKAQSLGISLSAALNALMERLGEVGSAIVVIARAISKVTVVVLNSLSLVVTSAEEVFEFSKRVIFAPSTITWEDLTSIAIPFAVCMGILTLLYYRYRSSRQAACIPCEKPVPRRSSRLARKRAMMMCADMSDTLLPRKKLAATTPSNL